MTRGRLASEIITGLTSRQSITDKEFNWGLQAQGATEQRAMTTRRIPNTGEGASRKWLEARRWRECWSPSNPVHNSRPGGHWPSRRSRRREQKRGGSNHQIWKVASLANLSGFDPALLTGSQYTYHWVIRRWGRLPSEEQPGGGHCSAGGVMITEHFPCAFSFLICFMVVTLFCIMILSKKNICMDLIAL